MKDWVEIIGVVVLAVGGFIAAVFGMVLAALLPVLLSGAILGALGAAAWFAFKFITGLV